MIADATKNFLKSNDLPNAKPSITKLIRGVGVIGQPLDAVVDKVNFIKIDVEGMEPEVLRGSSSLIDRWKPIIFIEINSRRYMIINTKGAI